jgi:hypothetical protein
MFPHSRPPAVTKVTFGKTYHVKASRSPAVTKVTFGKTYRVEVCVPAGQAAEPGQHTAEFTRHPPIGFRILDREGFKGTTDETIEKDTVMHACQTTLIPACLGSVGVSRSTFRAW